MRIYVSNMVLIQDAPENIKRWVEQQLTFINPKHEQNQRLANPDPSIKPEIKLYHNRDNGLIVPRGFGQYLVEKMHRSSVPFELVDHRLAATSIDYGSRIQLRHYQQQAVSAMTSSAQGGIIAPCGAGKTMILLEAIARSKQKALWITHTKELAYQALERANQVFSLEEGDTGMIGDGKHEIGAKLTVALVQTLMRTDLKTIREEFGCIVVDEAHRMAARSFYIPVNQFSAKYRYWVTATPDRSDGLLGVVKATGGPILYTINQCEVPTIIPDLKIIETNYQNLAGEEQYTRMITDVVNDFERNHLIVQTIINAYEKGDFLLILSDRLEHLQTLKAALDHELKSQGSVDETAILSGQLKKKDREKVMERVKDKEIPILFATQLAREGLDLPFLNKLFLTSPKKAEGAIQQEVGRIMRPDEGKETATVYDFADINDGLLEYQFRKRLKAYEKTGMSIPPLPVYERS